MFESKKGIVFLCGDFNIILLDYEHPHCFIITLQFQKLHFECQCLSANLWTYLLDAAVMASALPRMMATEIC